MLQTGISTLGNPPAHEAALQGVNSPGTKGRAVVIHRVPTHRRLGDISLVLGFGRKVIFQALRRLLPREEVGKGQWPVHWYCTYLTIEVTADRYGIVARMAGRQLRSTCLYDWGRGRRMDTG